MFARIIDGQIVALGSHPDVEWDGERWWDLRDPDVRTARGWLEVTLTDRPGDTATTTHDLSYEVLDGQPVQVWTAREWTASELADRARAANEAALRDGLDTVLTRATERQAVLRTVKNTANNTINASPASYIKTVADATRQTSGDIIRLARLFGGLTDSTSTGDDN